MNLLRMISRLAAAGALASLGSGFVRALRSPMKLQSRLQRLVEACRGHLPEANVGSAVELVVAGEPGVAIENLWGQRAEHGAHLPVEVVRELQDSRSG